MKLKHYYVRIRTIIEILKLENPWIHVQMILWAFCQSTASFVVLYGYSIIVDALVTVQYDKAIQIVVFMLLTSTILHMIANFLEFILTGSEANANRLLSSQVAYKAFTIKYDVYETKDYMDKINSVNSNVNATGGTNVLIEETRYLYMNFFSFLYASIFVGILIHMTATIGWLFALLLLMICCIYLGMFISHQIEKTFMVVNERNLKANATVGYIINTMTAIQYKKEIMINQMQKVFQQYAKKGFLNLEYYLDFGKISGRYEGFYTFALAIFGALTYIYIAFMSFQGYVSIGSILLYASAIQRMTEYSSNLVKGYTGIKFRLDYLDDFTKLIEDNSNMPTGSLPIEKRDDGQYEFVFEDVSFHYPNSEKIVLSHVNLTFHIGEKLAVVGRNGAGKTTLIKLLCRLYSPTEGRILLNGIDIQKYDFNEYTQIFSPVFQDFGLFHMSVEENIVCGYQKETEIEQVLKLVGVDQRIQQEENGIQMVLEDLNGTGVKLSGGETQKLAIGRALYKNAPFVILDEPTAALDPFSEAEIYENFDRLIKGKTAIYISHRMSSCRFCDRIIVFKDGAIVEEGIHDVLVKQNGEYQSLYDAQADYYNE